MILMDVGEYDIRRPSLYIEFRLYYRLRPWTPLSISRAISAVAELLVFVSELGSLILVADVMRQTKLSV